MSAYYDGFSMILASFVLYKGGLVQSLGAIKIMACTDLFGKIIALSIGRLSDHSPLIKIVCHLMILLRLISLVL